MISVASKKNDTLTIQKSKFICKVIPLTTVEEVQKELEIVREEYKAATHYCYAYLFDNQKRFSDDGEPSGTAGMPILKVIENQGLDHILVIVIRYFGGIKLGAGGLVRAYTNAVVNTLNQVEKVSLIRGNLIEITFPYDQEKTILNVIHPYPILEKNYQEQVTYKLFLPEEYLKKLENHVYQILEKNILGQEKKA